MEPPFPIDIPSELIGRRILGAAVPATLEKTDIPVVVQIIPPEASSGKTFALSAQKRPPHEYGLGWAVALAAGGFVPRLAPKLFGLSPEGGRLTFASEAQGISPVVYWMVAEPSGKASGRPASRGSRRAFVVRADGTGRTSPVCPGGDAVDAAVSNPLSGHGNPDRPRDLPSVFGYPAIFDDAVLIRAPSLDGELAGLNDAFREPSPWRPLV